MFVKNVWKIMTLNTCNINYVFNLFIYIIFRYKGIFFIVIGIRSENFLMIKFHPVI